MNSQSVLIAKSTRKFAFTSRCTRRPNPRELLPLPPPLTPRGPKLVPGEPPRQGRQLVVRRLRHHRAKGCQPREAATMTPMIPAPSPWNKRARGGSMATRVRAFPSPAGVRVSHASPSPPTMCPATTAIPAPCMRSKHQNAKLVRVFQMTGSKRAWSPRPRANANSRSSTFTPGGSILTM